MARLHEAGGSGLGAWLHNCTAGQPDSAVGAVLWTCAARPPGAADALCFACIELCSAWVGWLTCRPPPICRCRTFTTSYAGSVQHEGASSSSDGSSGSGAAAPPATATAATNGSDGSSAAAGAGEPQAGGAAAGALPQWQASSEQIPRALLTSRDPILFYDELPLFESELDDHGSSRVSLKVTG